MHFYYGTTAKSQVGASELTPSGAHPHSTPDSGIRYSLDCADREADGAVSYPANQSKLSNQDEESLSYSRGLIRSKQPEANHEHALSLTQAALYCSQSTDFMSEKLPDEGWDYALGLAKRMSGRTREYRPGFPTGTGGGY